MKKQQYSLFLSLTFCLIMTSCEKYLDIKRTNSQAPISTVNDLQLLLDQDAMNSGVPSDMNASADEYYLTDDAYTSGAINDEDRNFYIRTPNAIRSKADQQWEPAYNVIYNANLALEYADKFKKTGGQNQAILDGIRGAALFYRAHMNWWLAQLYAKAYNSSTASQDLGIPLRLASDINEKIVKATVEQTYARILQDLQEAVGLLPNTVIVSTRPSKAAAYAMLARVNLSMENYSQALNNATASLQINNNLLDFNTISQITTAPFPLFNKEVLFHSTTVINALLDPGSSTLVSKVNPDMVNSYSINDLRGKLFIKPNSGVNSSTYFFSGSYNGSLSSGHFNGLATDEVYLTRAECYARAGDVTSAMSDLNTLLRTRWVTGTYADITASSADDALVKILTERRKELLQRGLRWTDLRRLNKDSRFAVTLSRTVQGTVYTLPPNDLRYTLLIPNAVIQIGNIAQNSR